MLGEGLTDYINGNVSTAEKKFSVNSIKAKPKFCFSFHYNDGSSHSFVKGKECISLKLIVRM